MKLLLSDEDIIKLVYNAFVNGGLTELGFSDIEIKYFDSDYEQAKNVLKVDEAFANTIICYEDVLIQLFKDGKLVFIDHNEDKRYEFTPAFVRSNLDAVLCSDKADANAIELVNESLNEDGDDDAFTHWNILQYMLFKELIYG